MRTCRVLLVGMGVVLLAAVLAGCVPLQVGSIILGARQSAPVEAAGATIEKNVKAIPGVTGVTLTGNVNKLDGELTLMVNVTAPRATTKALSTIVAAVADGFHAPALLGAGHQLNISAGSRGEFDDQAFDALPAELAVELDYWTRASDAIHTPLTLTVRQHLDGVDYDRLFGVKRGTGVTARQLLAHYGDLVRVSDTSKASTVWSLPGFTSSGALPPVAVVDSFASLAQRAPLLGEETKAPSAGLQLNWVDRADSPQGLTIQYSPLDDQVLPLVKQRDWPTVVTLMRMLADSPLQNVTFGYTPSVANGQVCLRSSVPFNYANAQDTEFVVALAAAGVALPDSSYAGHCEGPEMG